MYAQKNRLIDTVLLSTHDICFGWEIRKLVFRYALFTKVLILIFGCHQYILSSRPLDKND